MMAAGRFDLGNFISSLAFDLAFDVEGIPVIGSTTPVLISIP